MNITDNKIPQVFICIGSNNLIGDCLGPLVGSFLKNKFYRNKNIKIFGDIVDPVNYNNINFIINKINNNYKNNCTRIIIDAALGEKIGEVTINSGNLIIGCSLNKRKIVYGDIIIKGVVGKNYNNLHDNINELKKPSFYTISKIAQNIADTIQ